MPKIICIAHQKGGVGKSTLALNLSSCLSEQLNVSLVDTDLQGSITGLKLLVDGINLLPFNNESNYYTQQPYDVIIIDTPPYLSAQLPRIFAMSDYVLVPSKAGFFDLMALKSTIALISEAIIKKPNLKAGIVFNMVKHNSSISGELKGLINNEKIPVLDSVITDRVSYTRSVLNGGVFKTSDDKAKQEITSLVDEILNNIGL